MVTGNKVILVGREGAGFGQIASGEAGKDCVEVRFFINAVSFLSVMAPRASVRCSLANLVGLKQGNLREAMRSIRRQLRAREQQLLLLIEDLSVSQGVDRELVEAPPPRCD